MSRTISWIDRGDGLYQRVVSTEITRDEWLVRLRHATSRLQRVSIIGGYRNWVRQNGSITRTK